MRIKDKPELIFLAMDNPTESDIPFENLEKLLNSYKNL